MPDTFVQLPEFRVKERSAFTITARFRDSSFDGSAPTTARYRIDCLTTGTVIKDWTTLSVAASIAISVTATDNRIIGHGNALERRQITVQADQGTDAETRDVGIWDVENIRGYKD